jgi:hypothetical protein
LESPGFVGAWAKVLTIWGGSSEAGVKHDLRIDSKRGLVGWIMAVLRCGSYRIDIEFARIVDRKL